MRLSKVRLWSAAASPFAPLALTHPMWPCLFLLAYYALISRYLPPAERPPIMPAGQELSRPVTTFTAIAKSGRVSPHPGPATTRQPVHEFGTMRAADSIGSASSEIVYESQTAWAFLGGSKRLGLSLVRLHPISGRKHQLRVFCAETLRAPIVGDELYGYQPPPPHLAAGGGAGGKARSVRRQGGEPPSPTTRTPLFLKCVSISLTTLAPSGRPKALVVRERDVPGADGAGWPGVRPWLDDWVGEHEEALRRQPSPEAVVDEAKEARERQIVLERRKRRKEAKKGGRAAAPSSEADSGSEVG
jgi:hypothetical protein